MDGVDEVDGVDYVSPLRGFREESERIGSGGSHRRLLYIVPSGLRRGIRSPPSRGQAARMEIYPNRDGLATLTNPTSGGLRRGASISRRQGKPQN